MDNPWATTWDQEWPTEKRTDHFLHGDAQWESEDQSARSTSPARDPAPDPTQYLQTTISPADDDWGTTWSTASTLDIQPKDTRPPDQWEAARQEKEKLNRAVPPELLDSLLRHCHQLSQDIWSTPAPGKEQDWKSGLEEHADIIALLAQLLPSDSTVSPPVQFSATATAKAMNEALKLTRHLPAAASSPLSRLLASKGSLEWEKLVKATQDVIPVTAHVGWRVLEKEDRLPTLEESKPRKVAGGLLSFWNRRSSTIQTASVETPRERERSTSPARLTPENVKSASFPPSASPPKASTTSVPPPPPTDSVAAAAPPPSAVSRFLNRFSRIRGPHHSALALSPDDLEFLSDIVPSASDPPDEAINDSTLDALTSANNSPSLPPKLPPLIPPPPKQPTLSSRPSSVLGLGILDSATAQTCATNHTAHVPVLAPQPSPMPAVSFSLTPTPPLDVAPTVAPILSIQKTHQSSSQPSSRLLSSFTHPPAQKVIPLLAIPPLLPPTISPPQTPRTFTPKPPGDLSMTPSTSFHDSDDEFSAFASFPPPAPMPFPSSKPYHPEGPPSPPSPPPRRSYERTHYPSSASTSSTMSPASQSSLDRLCCAKSSVSASLDSFDDFVSPPPVVRGENRERTPPPPPPLLPVKSQLPQRQPLLRLDTSSHRGYHAYTLSQTGFASPTAHTNLMHGALPSPTVSEAEHRRTQGLVNHAAACGGALWPNSPDVAEPKVKAIPPPLWSTSTSPEPLIRQDGFDLLGDGDIIGGSGLAAPLSLGSSSLPATSGPGELGLGFGNQPQPHQPPLSSAPLISLSSFGTRAAAGSLQPARPRQTGGLSAQDLSFFEGL